MKVNGIRVCPVCQRRVDTVFAYESDTVGEPINEQFWGRKGDDRAILHNDHSHWFHFRVGDSHRLAYMDGKCQQNIRSRNGT